jgi:hypothetical protein
MQFKKFFARTLSIYAQSHLDASTREAVYASLVETYTNHLLSLRSVPQPARSPASRLKSRLSALLRGRTA